jgi:transcriptional regulator with XRE-family HTH domain
VATEPAGILDEALRLEGLSARDLSRLTGIAESRISDYRNGRHDPGAARLMELLEAAGLEIRLAPNLDRNGLILGELLDLADALAAGTSVAREARIPSFAELTQRHG